MFPETLGRCFSRLLSSSSANAKGRRKPAFETLEDRLALTAGVTVDADLHRVVVTGEEATGNEISIDYNNRLAITINNVEYLPDIPTEFPTEPYAVEVKGGNSPDGVTVNFLPLRWALDIDTRDGPDAVTLNYPIGESGQVEVYGTPGDAIRLTINDQANAEDTHYWVNRTTNPQGDPVNLVRWQVDSNTAYERTVFFGADTRTNVILLTGDANNNVRVRALDGNNSLEVRGRAGNETFLVYNNANSLDEIKGPVKLLGGGGTNSLLILDTVIADTGLPGRTNYELGNRGYYSYLGWANGAREVCFGQMATTELYLSDADDTVALKAGWLYTTTTINGGGGRNTVIGANEDNHWMIDGPNSGSVNYNPYLQASAIGLIIPDVTILTDGGPTLEAAHFGFLPPNGVRFHNFENVTGGSASDTFNFLSQPFGPAVLIPIDATWTITPTPGSIRGILDGADGTDTAVAVPNGTQLRNIEILLGAPGDGTYVVPDHQLLTYKPGEEPEGEQLSYPVYAQPLPAESQGPFAVYAARLRGHRRRRRLARGIASTR